MLSMTAGVRKMVGASTDADHLFITSSNAGTLLGSAIPRPDVAIVEDAPGMSMSSRVALIMMDARSRRDLSRVGFPLSGVDQSYFRLYPSIKLTKGRRFRSGEHELIVSDSQSAQLQGLDIGNHVELRGEPWLVVGHFSSDLTAVAPAITDATTLGTALSSDSIQYVVVQLDSTAALKGLRDLLNHGPSVSLQIRTEPVVMEAVYQSLTSALTTVSYFVGAVMGFGATIGAIATMHVLMHSRRQETATLRAIGFGGGPVFCGLVLECILFCLAGAVLGCGAAWLLCNGTHASPLGSSIVLAVTPRVAVTGIAWALAMGTIGGTVAVITGARGSIALALQQA
jgi:putative ABC transport system permease protein